MQPVHFVIVDFASLTKSDFVPALCDSLQNVLMLMCELRGSSRMLAFGLILAHEGAEIVLPLLQPSKVNIPRVLKALETLKTLERCSRNVEESFSAFTECFQLILEQWKKFKEQQTEKNAEQHAQLQVTLLSCLSETVLVENVKKAIQDTDMKTIKKILVVSMKSLQHGKHEDETMQKVMSPQQILGTSSPIGLIDIIGNVFSHHQLDEIFRTWFHDLEGDEEHLQLIFSTTKDDFVIHCDQFEKLVDPNLLSCSKHFNLKSDATLSIQRTTDFRKSSDLQSKGPFHLHVLSFVKQSGICDSVVFGMPHILVPTRCWKIDWEQLESNQQHFHLLCRHLTDNNLAIIAEMKTQSVKFGLDTKSCANFDSEAISGHFVILPSMSDSLLLKTIATSELLLPNVPNNIDHFLVPENVHQRIDKVLCSVPTDEIYNPLHFASNLFRAIKSTHLRVHEKTYQRSSLHQKKNSAAVFKQPQFMSASNVVHRGGTK